MLNRIKNALYNRLIFNYFKPKMILLKRCVANDKKLTVTRISNTTSILNPEKLIIGNNVFIGHFNLIDASNNLIIEDGSQITNYVSILTHSSHIAVRLYGSQYTNTKSHIGYISGKVIIGKYSFIGPHTTIMPNTKLGKGTLVSSHSYIKSGEYPDFAILAGNPAQIVGDTRTIDEKYLLDNPELKIFYNNWAHDDR